MKKNKTIGLIIISLIYIFTISLGVLIYFLLPSSMKTQPLIPLLIIDVICTVIIYIFSRIFNNSSIYDPYWSVAPIVLYVAFILITGYNNYITDIFLVLIAFWSGRLTLNWALGFKNLGTQDWRYQGFKEKHPKTYFLIDLFGIHLFPTIIVFIGMMPGFFFIEKACTTQLNLTVLLGALVMLFAIIIEMISDIQMYNFRKNNKVKGAIMNKGLWKISRHPNYFGEILFWISIWLLYFGAESNFGIGFITAFCPIAVFVMFVFVSIPMLEKRQLKNKPGYKEYMENTNMLLIYPLLKNKK